MKESFQSPLLQTAGGGLSCFYRGRRLYHPERPVEQAEARAEAFPLKPDTLYLIPSPLLWYGVQRLLERLDGRSALLALEDDEQLYRLSLEHMPPSLADSPRLRFMHLERALEDEESIDCLRFRRVEMVPLNGGFGLGRERYTMLHRHLERRIKIQWQNRMTLSWFGPLWLKNFFYNCGQLPSLSAGGQFSPGGTAGNHTGRPILIAGAGPSLDYALEEISSIRERIHIIAVDTALSALESKGLKADGIVCQDGQYYTVGDFTAAPSSFDSRFFLDLTSFRALPRHIRGVVEPFISRFDSVALFDRFARLFPEIPFLPPVGSVGITALLIARSLRPSALLFAGLDFAYYLGKSHARGTPYHLRELAGRNRLSPEGDFRTILRRHPIALRSKGLPVVMNDLVLSGYAENFSERLRDCSGSAPPPCYLFPETLRTLCPLTEESAEAFLDRIPAGKAPADDNGCSPDKNFEERMLHFLNDEREMLRRFINGDMELWKSMDYLYSFFPDYHRQDKERPDEQFRRRAISSAGRFFRIIDQSLTFPRS